MPGIVNTELAAGLQQARGVKNVNPEDVADAIVEALQRPALRRLRARRRSGRSTQVIGLLPRSGREAFARALKADQVLAQADPSARRAYELRAAHSEPGPRARRRAPSS